MAESHFCSLFVVMPKQQRGKDASRSHGNETNPGRNGSGRKRLLVSRRRFLTGDCEDILTTLAFEMEEEIEPDDKQTFFLLFFSLALS